VKKSQRRRAFFVVGTLYRVRTGFFVWASAGVLDAVSPNHQDRGIGRARIDPVIKGISRSGNRVIVRTLLLNLIEFVCTLASPFRLVDGTMQSEGRLRAVPRA
jgi:hypothetical protein